LFELQAFLFKYPVCNYNVPLNTVGLKELNWSNITIHECYI
jgi:hypothetical protein